MEISDDANRIVYQIVVDNEIVYVGQSKYKGISRALEHGFSRGTVRYVRVGKDMDLNKIESLAILKSMPKNQTENRRFRSGNPLRLTPPLSVSTTRYMEGQAKEVQP